MCSYKMRIFLILLTPTALAASCLPNALVAGQRQNLTNAVGESYPIGVVLGTWRSAYLSSAIFEILAEEVMGYNIRVEGREVSSSVQGAYALLGCATWYDVEDRGCSKRQVRIHLQADSWWLGFPDIVAAVEERYKAEAPVNGGSMGWTGDSGMYVPRSVLDAGEAHGEAMEYYKSYNARWHEPWKYFDNISRIENISEEFMPCSDSQMFVNSTAFTYLELTGDAAGVVVSGTPSTYRANCDDGYTWKSPSCRSKPLQCILYISAGDGWGIAQGMQRSAIFNIPMVLGVASSYAKYLEVPSKFVGLFYWWAPDDSFLDIAPELFVLPPHNKFAFLQGDLTTSSQRIEVTKVISSDLEFMAPDFVKLLQASQMQLEEINSMMRDWIANSSASRHDIACQWLLSNPQRWQSWIPDPTVCSRGYGLYNEGTVSFTAARASATTCRPCPPGMYSVPFADDSGATYVCEACPPGTQQPTAGAVECLPCPTGTSKAEVSVDECAPCIAGFYQDEKGSFTCKQCPAGTTTLLLGTKTGLGCGCEEGSIDTSPDRFTAAVCVKCSAGLKCPTLSTVQNLMSGTSSLGPKTVPQVEQGYYSTIEEPLRTWECNPASGCPGGKPGVCQGGLEGVPCSQCPNGQTLVQGICRDCVGGTFVPLLVLLLLGLVGLTKSYDLLNKPVSLKASPLASALLGAGFTVNVLQVVAIFGMMTLKWSADFESTSGALQIFMLDLQTLRVTCILGPTPLASFLLRALVFPGAALWLLVCYVASRLWGEPWKLSRVISTIGMLFAAGFGTMAAVAMQPFMCYQHPNGRSSLLKYPGVVCGSAQHSNMLVTGVALGVLAVGFFASCCYAAWKMPRWSQEGSPSMQACRFLHANFRLSAWWFGLLPLIRGFGFAFSIVVATNVPAVQVAIASVLLLAYVIVQALLQPWKARLTNAVDLLLSAILLLLISASMQEDREKEERFAAAWTLISLSLLTLVLAVMILASIAALCVAKCGGDPERMLNMGESWVLRQEVLALKSCAEALLEVQADELMSGFKELNPYDLKLLANAIEIVDSLLFTRFSSRTTRLTASGITGPSTKEPSTEADDPSLPEPVAKTHAQEAEEFAELALQTLEEDAAPDARGIVSMEC